MLSPKKDHNSETYNLGIFVVVDNSLKLQPSDLSKELAAEMEAPAKKKRKKKNLDPNNPDKPGKATPI